MKLSNIKYDKYSRSYSRTGRKKGYRVEIAYSDAHKYYYFLIEKNIYLCSKFTTSRNKPERSVRRFYY